ncbi:hypothetical protein ANN_27413 [Periplaneta americana]|uniref:PiggyBac transposable element-derived protein domain-containing protein n=1 Tax=Periplaneta americana TaxID=6978 RepID=A0ABQ8RVP1_PERAM|nr:hypothetical protein ANN_27413 [Periplaneta americana]
MEKSYTLKVASREAGLVVAREAGLVVAREEGVSAFLKQEPAITIGPAKEPEASILAERELDDKTLVSYVPKKGKFVCLISSMHHDSSIAENGKPEIIEDYNRTKGEVDSLDQKCANYSVQRRKRR